MSRLAVLATHPIQYQAPLWRWLARQPEIDVHAVFGSDFSVRGYRDRQFGVDVKWDVPLTEGYEHTFLSVDPAIQGTDGFFRLRAGGLRAVLRKFQPDYILFTAYMPYFWWEALWVARTLGVPVILRAETTETAVTRTTAKRLARNIFLRSFYSNCRAFLAIGKNSAEHYLAHGIAPDRLGWSPYCVDTDMFSNQVDRWLPQRDGLRAHFGFAASQRVFLFSGKLYDVKNPLLIAEALDRLSPEVRARIGLLVLGDGELRNAMEERCSRALGRSAVFAGFVNQTELGKYYAAADCLVLPSLSETWGLVVNEALQFGMMAITSNRVGCAPDLVLENQTGFVFASGDAAALADCFQRAIASLDSDAGAIRENCRLQVSAYSIEEAGNGILAMVTRLNSTGAAG